MIRLKKLGKAFEAWVFRELDLEVPQGGCAAIVGPSGSGKSVLLKLIAGLIQPDEGRVELQGASIGMLFQQNALFDSMSVEENLLFPMREKTGQTSDELRPRALEILASVGLSGTENLSPNNLSGGMQKRLGIARAVALEPEILLYDDPTAGLDPITSRTIVTLIDELRKKTGSTLVIVTNEMRRAYQLADRVYLLAEGKLRDGGSPDQLRATTDPVLHQFISGEDHAR